MIKERVVTEATNSRDNIRKSRTITKKPKQEKNNCTDTSNDKLTKFHKRRMRHG